MSLVYITYHNENIFDVEEAEASAAVPRRARYKSQHACAVRQETARLDCREQPDGSKLLMSAKKASHKTMGYAVTPQQPPCAYLRRHQGVRWRRLREHVCPPPRGMPLVPRYVRPPPAKEPKPTTKPPLPPRGPHCPQRLTGHKHRANFIAVNVERTKKAVTRRPPPRYVDTPNGDTHAVLNSGLLPQYICQRKFGKVPPYLRAHKQMLQRLRARCTAEQAEQDDASKTYARQGIRQLNAEERQEILQGLRTNFVELNKQYQKLPLFTDTLPKKLRKGQLEKELRQIEQDIFLMESNPVIFVSDF